MITVNNQKAIEIAKDRIRKWREKEFAKNDLAIQNALLDSTDTAALVERRNYLRDLPTVCENKTVEELLELIKTLGV